MVHIVVDAYSRFADVEVTRSTTGEELMPKLDKLWVTYGIMSKLVSDNGPPYKSDEFRSMVWTSSILLGSNWIVLIIK